MHHESRVLIRSMESTTFFSHDAFMKDDSTVQNRSITCERVKERVSEETRGKVRRKREREGWGEKTKKGLRWISYAEDQVAKIEEREVTYIQINICYTKKSLINNSVTIRFSREFFFLKVITKMEKSIDGQKSIRNKRNKIMYNRIVRHEVHFE